MEEPVPYKEILNGEPMQSLLRGSMTGFDELSPELRKRWEELDAAARYGLVVQRLLKGTSWNKVLADV